MNATLTLATKAELTAMAVSPKNEDKLIQQASLSTMYNVHVGCRITCLLALRF